MLNIILHGSARGAILSLRDGIKILTILGLLIFHPDPLFAQDECLDPGGDCTLSNPVTFDIDVAVVCGDTLTLNPTDELCNTWMIPDGVNFFYGTGDDSLVVNLVVDQCYPEPLIVDGLTNTPSGSGVASCDTRFAYHIGPDVDTTARGVNCAEFAALDSLTLMLPSSCGCDSLLLELFLDEAVDTTYQFAESCNPADAGVSTETLTAAATGCDSIVITTTELNDAPELFLDDAYACAGQTAYLDAFALVDGTYLWQDGSTDFGLEVSTPGAYSVTFTDENDCSVTATASAYFTDIAVDLAISIAEEFVLSADPLRVWEGSAVELEAVVSTTPFNYEIIWNGGPEVGDTTYNHIAREDAVLQVAVIDSLGCFGTAFVEVLVEPIKVYLPTAFSPNDDDVNDRLVVYTSPNVAEVRLQLYGRTGGTVFDERLVPTDFLESGVVWDAWDGRYRGRRLTPQVFAYQLWYRAIQGEWRNRSGDVTLMR